MSRGSPKSPGVNETLAASPAPSSRVFVPALMLLVVCGVAGCAGTPASWTRFEHAEWGYSVPYPSSLAKVVWRELRIDDADLAFRGPKDAVMAISSHCEERIADPVILAKQLLVGLGKRTSVTSERFEFAGGRAFSQVVDSSAEETAVRTKTVTLVRGGCVVDWVLTAKGSLAENVEASFDAWWRGFDPGSMPRSVTADPTPDPAPDPILEEVTAQSESDEIAELGQ